ncbi:MAG: hypothetical protein MR710_06395, partial [Bacteroidales bacterium]|nr:hypothetical protein [Bacteroidales bacterium]
SDFPSEGMFAPSAAKEQDFHCERFLICCAKVVESAQSAKSCHVFSLTRHSFLSLRHFPPCTGGVSKEPLCFVAIGFGRGHVVHCALIRHSCVLSEVTSPKERVRKSEEKAMFQEAV